MERQEGILLACLSEHLPHHIQRKKRSHVCEHDHGGYWKQLAPCMIVLIPHTASWDSASMVESSNAASPSAFCPLPQALAFHDRDMHLPRLLPIDHLHTRDQVSNRPSSARVPHDPSPAGPPPRAMPASASPTPLLQFRPPFSTLSAREIADSSARDPKPPIPKMVYPLFYPPNPQDRVLHVLPPPKSQHRSRVVRDALILNAGSRPSVRLELALARMRLS